MDYIEKKKCPPLANLMENFKKWFNGYNTKNQYRKQIDILFKKKKKEDISNIKKKQIMYEYMLID